MHWRDGAGGAGLLLGSVPGTPAANVTIIGGGVSGTEAARIALGIRAIVRVFWLCQGGFQPSSQRGGCS